MSCCVFICWPAASRSSLYRAGTTSPPYKQVESLESSIRCTASSSRRVYNCPPHGRLEDNVHLKARQIEQRCSLQKRSLVWGYRNNTTSEIQVFDYDTMWVEEYIRSRRYVSGVVLGTDRVWVSHGASTNNKKNCTFKIWNYLELDMPDNPRDKIHAMSF